jgi:predicted nucleic acid-binding protein
VALVTPVFFDTTILLGGCIDFGRSSVHAQQILDDVADGTIGDAVTSWHCCLEFYAVATRLPDGYRLEPQQAWSLLQEILRMFRTEQLPVDARLPFFEISVRERVAGGRIYDAHIAEIARLAGAAIVVTDNRRHFSVLMKHGVKVLGASEFAEERRRG